jgi:hypothetical protein
MLLLEGQDPFNQILIFLINTEPPPQKEINKNNWYQCILMYVVDLHFSILSSNWHDFPKHHIY